METFLLHMKITLNCSNLNSIILARKYYDYYNKQSTNTCVYIYYIYIYRSSLVTQMVKILPGMQV